MRAACNKAEQICRRRDGDHRFNDKLDGFFFYTFEKGCDPLIRFENPPLSAFISSGSTSPVRNTASSIPSATDKTFESFLLSLIASFYTGIRNF
jgi:hypothetical protein